MARPQDDGVSTAVLGRHGVAEKVPNMPQASLSSTVKYRASRRQHASRGGVSAMSPAASLISESAQ
jgi:hypothetical protein